MGTLSRPLSESSSASEETDKAVDPFVTHSVRASCRLRLQGLLADILPHTLALHAHDNREMSLRKLFV